MSSFGLGGTNAHVVLEEAPTPECGDESPRRWELVPISARTETALETATENLGRHLAGDSNLCLADAAYTLQTGRPAFPHRRVLVTRDVTEASEVLLNRDKARLFGAVRKSAEQRVAFMFSGVGDQYPSMGSGLYEDEPIFREEFDTCCALLNSHLGFDLRDAIFDRHSKPDDQAGTTKLDLVAMLKRGGADRSGADRRLDQPRYSQPAAFAIDYALAKLWMSWGIQPSAMIGHSIGEYVAACLAGVFSLRDAAMLVAQRALLIDQLPGGAMLAIMATEEELAGVLPPGVSVAAINAPRLCVVSGSAAAIDQFERGAHGFMCQRVPASHAYHSRMLLSAAERLAELVGKSELHPPRIPYISNLTGTWTSAEQASDPRYWADHTCQTVRFSDGINRLLEDRDCALIEVGAGQALTSFGLQTAATLGADMPLVVPSLRNVYQREADSAFILTSLSKLWLAGIEINWDALGRRGQRRRISLPGYPFERKRHWVEAEPPPVRSTEPGAASGTEAVAEKRPLEEWFYTPAWVQRDLPICTDPAGAKQCWMVFLDQCGIGEKLVQRLETLGHRVVSVRPGQKFRREAPRKYCIDPDSQPHYDLLLQQLASLQRYPGRIAHCWSITSGDAVPTLETFARAQSAGFSSLLRLARAMGDQRPKGHVRLLALSSGLHDILGEELQQPEKATLLGASGVIAKEYDFLDCRSVDLALSQNPQSADGRIINQIISEAETDRNETVVAYRGRHRWVREFSRIPVEAVADSTLLRERGVYLITGGLGGIGLGIAAHLARKYHARLALVGRTGLPRREDWHRWLAEHDRTDPISLKIEKVQDLEGSGAEVEVIAADVL